MAEIKDVGTEEWYWPSITIDAGSGRFCVLYYDDHFDPNRPNNPPTPASAEDLEIARKIGEVLDAS